MTAAAIDAAKARFAVGWPLLILAIALYSPLTGLPQLFLLAAGLWFLSRDPAGHRTTTPAAKPTTKTPRRRSPEGKWTK